MKRISLLISLMLLNSVLLLAQSHLRDSKTKEPIPYARILNHQGMLIAVSDIEGRIPKLKLTKDSVSIEHIAYISKKLSVQELNEDVFLEEKSIPLNECLVTAKKVDYLRLRTYYRSLQLNDSITKYACEGIMDFYIKLSNHKVKRVLRAESIYQNKELIAKDKQRTNMVSDRYTAQPYLEKHTLLELCQEKKKYDYADSTGLIYKKDIPMAVVSRDSLAKVCRIDYDNLAEYGGEKSITLFGYTTRLVKVLGTENFLIKQSSTPSYKDLINSSKYRMIYYKHKKDKHWQRCEITDELYVLERELLSKEEMKEALKKTFNPAESNAKIKELGLELLKTKLNEYQVNSL